MTERTYRLFFGSTLLIALYFDFNAVVLGLVALSLFQGITGWRLARIVTYVLHRSAVRPGETAAALASPIIGRTALTFDAERASSLLVAAVITLGSAVFTDSLWFMPWFVGFALFGAGLSGVCPMVLGFKWAGLK